MMLEAIEGVLAGRKGIADWLLVELRRSSSELYAIRRRIDISRRVESLEYSLVVYVDAVEGGTRTRGEAKVTIHPTMSADELSAIVDRAVFAASRSRNPWFHLPEPAPALLDLPPNGFEGRSLSRWSAELLEFALGATSRGERPFGNSDPTGARLVSAARINSLELFLTKRDTRIRSSRGVDVGWSSHEGYIEYVVEAEGSAGEVELFGDLRFSEPDGDRLAREVGRSLGLVEDRAVAIPLPALGNLPLVLGGEEAASCLAWFFENADASRMWLGSSPLALGASVHGESAKPGSYDPIELAAEAILRGQPASSPFDGEGVPLARRPLIEGGKLLALHGPTRYTDYLKLPGLGSYRLFSVGPGSASGQALRALPHLEVARFSDFNVDPDSGDFGGEIRLGWYFDGIKRVPVFGGSVTGSLFENRGLIRMSKEICLAGSMLGPSAIRLPSVSITAAASET